MNADGVFACFRGILVNCGSSRGISICIFKCKDINDDDGYATRPKMYIYNYEAMITLFSLVRANITCTYRHICMVRPTGDDVDNVQYWLTYAGETSHHP